MSRFLPFALAALLAIASNAPAQEVPEEAVAAARAAGEGDWAAGMDAAGSDPALRDMVTWLRLREGGAPFADYAAFLADRPDWPDQNRLRARAEAAMPAGLPVETVFDFFAGEAPRTGTGAVRLAEAHSRNGAPDRGKEILRTAWRELRLSRSDEALILETFGDVVADDHVARTDALLWRWRTDEAARMLDRLDPDQAALAAARIAFIRKSGNIDDKVKAVPAALRDDPGLAYDRYNWLADRGRRAEAVAILQDRSTDAAALGQPFRWSGWRRTLARWEMREGRPDAAYDLASRHFLNAADHGATYADLEWLSGYLQLTYLDDPAAALDHFRAAAVAVDSPISSSRMAYWQGRALEALDRDPTDAYASAARHQTAFYGLLAAEKLGLPLDPALAEPAGTWDPTLLQNDKIKVALSLLAAGERGAAVAFFADLGRTLSESDLSALGAVLTDAEEVYFAVLLGKSAVTEGRVVMANYFPLHPLATEEMQVDPALALSIARRESEFNAGVGSPVGALGLMQLMPPTAEEMARFEGIAYSRPRLTSDWAYNAQLGLRYLAELEAQFGPSPVQIAAGYNAGPSRPLTWMAERGDPRTGAVDVIDWIEHIPFRETRNYVMRVSESIPVYRARLTGNTGPVRFTALLLGEKPLVRPVARGAARLPGESRVESVSTSSAPPRAVARPATPAVPAGPTPVRPIPRPGE